MNRSADPDEYRDVDGSHGMQPDEPRKYGRGLFLATVGAGLTSLVWGRTVWSRVSAALGPAEDLVPFAPHGWRIYSVAPTMPTFDRATWRLGVGGLVEQKLSLDYAQLRVLPRANQVCDFHCVTGWTVTGVRWGGVRLADIFDRARPYPEANAVQFVSAEEPYLDYLTMDEALLHDVMLAYEMDGKPLPREHGAPLRLVIPEMYGYKGVKWLEQINLVPRAEDGYWELLGYDRDAWVGRSNGYG
jgi:DMSO/TMAO reductase YedYZ molybdopterin-dependent catalytic subunit